MLGTTNIKFIDAQQAKLAYQYKNTKRKLYKTHAAIWYNKTCRKRNCCILLDLFHYYCVFNLNFPALVNFLHDIFPFFFQGTVVEEITGGIV